MATTVRPCHDWTPPPACAVTSRGSSPRDQSRSMTSCRRCSTAASISVPNPTSASMTSSRRWSGSISSMWRAVTRPARTSTGASTGWPSSTAPRGRFPSASSTWRPTPCRRNLSGRCSGRSSTIGAPSTEPGRSTSTSMVVARPRPIRSVSFSAAVSLRAVVSLHAAVFPFRRVGLLPTGRGAEGSCFSNSTTVSSAPAPPTWRRRLHRRWSTPCQVRSRRHPRHKRAAISPRC